MRYNNDEMRSFFENSFTADYLKYSDSSVRYAVTGISASCEILEDILKKNADAKTAALTENISAMCRRLMRMVRLGTALADAASLDGGELDLIGTDEFIEDFARCCNEVMSGKCTVYTSGKAGRAFRCSRELLTFFMLSFVRRALLADGRCKKIYISSEAADDKIRISVKVKRGRASVKSADQEFSETLDKFADEIRCLFEEKLGLECEYTKDALSFLIPEAQTGGDITFECRKTDFENGKYSDPSIMLGDIF